MAESEEELKSLLIKVKEESKKSGLKLNIQKTKIIASCPITSWQIDGEKMGTVIDFIFLSSKITVDGNCSQEIKRCLLLGKKAMTHLDSIFKKQRHHFIDKDPYSQEGGFSSSHTWMWDLDRKEGWALKDWYFQTVVLEKTLGILLDNEEIKPVNPKGNQPWIFIRTTDGEVKTPILWPSDMKHRLTGKDRVTGKNWRQKEKRETEDEMVR